MMGRTQDWDRLTRTVPSWENYAAARQRWMDTGSSVYLDQMVEAMPPGFSYRTVSQCCWRCLYHSLTDFYDDGPLVITSRDHEHPPTPEIRKGGV